MYLYSDSSSKPSAHYAFGEAPESPETLPDKPFQHERCGKIRHFTALPPAKTKKKPTLCRPDRLRSAPTRENKEKKLTLCRPDRLRSAPIRENKEKTADDTHLLLL